MGVYEEVKDALTDFKVNDVITSKQMRDILEERFGRNPGSVILSDYCYNRYNRGIEFTKHLFEHLNDGTYKYLGENFNYTGPIYHKPRGQNKEIIVGEWINGEKKIDKAKIEALERNEKESINVNCMLILGFLDMYAGHAYTKADKLTDIHDQEEMKKIAQAGSNAANEFEKLTSICNKIDGFKVIHNKTWLDGSNVKVRTYFWAELKKNGREDSPTSISIFAENLNSEGARFRFSIELKESDSKKIDYGVHHRILDKDINKAKIPLRFYSGGNNNGTLKELNITPDEIKKGLHNGEYRKIQLSHSLAKTDIDEQGLTNQDIVERMLTAVKELEPYYDYVFGEGNDTKVNGTGKNPNELDWDKNIILYGPPGTGKTYHSVYYAVAIIEKKSLNQILVEPYHDVLERYNKYKNTDERIMFTTFHQSYGYEEFIEGIKPVINVEESDQETLTYEIKSGAFKAFCEKAKEPVVENANRYGIRNNPIIWKVSLYSSGENKIRRDCFDKDRIRIGWDSYGENITDETVYKDGGKAILDSFINKMAIGDIVLTLYNERTIDAIGVVDGEYEWLKDEEDFRRSRSVKWIKKDIREDIVKLNDGHVLTLGSVYRLNRISLSDVINILEKYNINLDMDIKENENNYVFIIDEINRGNISKIFGELITLIEPDKRLGAKQELTVALPYSGDPSFGVPNNVYILGTMNTADRSIALLDTALRRRFQFSEMMPRPQLLANIHVEDINLEEMLKVINSRIEVLYDREHTIGHAYFMTLENDPTIQKLGSIFQNAIIPLLQEYFYEDYNKIQLVLSDNDTQKPDDLKFILDEEIKIKNVFKGQPDIDVPEKVYRINRDAFTKKEAYIWIYK